VSHLGMLGRASNHRFLSPLNPFLFNTNIFCRPFITIISLSISFIDWLQVKIHTLLQQSRFRTRKKEEADFFFVPAYVKCVRMLGGLNDKEINQAYKQVHFFLLILQQAKTVASL